MNKQQSSAFTFKWASLERLESTPSFKYFILIFLRNLSYNTSSSLFKIFFIMIGIGKYQSFFKKA